MKYIQGSEGTGMPPTFLRMVPTLQSLVTGFFSHKLNWLIPDLHTPSLDLNNNRCLVNLNIGDLETNLGRQKQIAGTHYNPKQAMFTSFTCG